MRNSCFKRLSPGLPDSLKVKRSQNVFSWRSNRNMKAGKKKQANKCDVAIVEFFRLLDCWRICQWADEGITGGWREYSV